MALPWLCFHATLLAPLHLIVLINGLPSTRKESTRPSVSRLLDVMFDHIHAVEVADAFNDRFWVSVLPSILLNQILPAFMARRGVSATDYSSPRTISTYMIRHMHSGQVAYVSSRHYSVIAMSAEFSSGMYSPEVFAIAQMLGELPYSMLCAFVYWIIMVTGSKTHRLNLQTRKCRFMPKDSVRVQLAWAVLVYNWW